MNLQTAQLTIRAWYGTGDVRQLARNLRMSVDDVHAEAERLGLRGKHRGLSQMAEAARCRAELKAANPPPKPKPVKAELPPSLPKHERDAALLAEYPHVPTRQLALKYGISEALAFKIAAKHGVRKSRQCLQASNARRNRRPERRCIRKPTVTEVRQTIDALRRGDTLTALHILEMFFTEAA